MLEPVVKRCGPPPFNEGREQALLAAQNPSNTLAGNPTVATQERLKSNRVWLVHMDRVRIMAHAIDGPKKKTDSLFSCDVGAIHAAHQPLSRTGGKALRRFAVRDCGCGIRLLRSRLGPDDLDASDWDGIADRLRGNKGGLGDLGGG